jgi:hypothetical protein
MEKVLYPGRGRLWLLTVASLMFARVSTGWVSLIWILVAMAFGISLLPGASWLKLDPTGFTIRSWFREKTYRWTDIAVFKLITYRYMGFIPVSRSVGFSFSASYRKKGLALKIASAIVRFDGSLPDNYGMKAQDLAAYLEACRQQAVPAIDRVLG